MIDEIRMQMLMEKINSAQDASEQSYAKFYEILSLIDEFSTTVDGYPAKAVELLDESTSKIDKIYDQICAIQNSMPSPNNQKITIKFWGYLLILFFVILGSYLGSVFHGLMFHN